MREIKFRAFQDKQMLTQPISGVYAANKFFLFLYEDTKLMQFTGLKDINGVDIYEGDIVKKNGWKGEIVFSKRYARYDMNYLNPFPDLPYSLPTNEWYSTTEKDVIVLEVIGNIHENPNLLTP